MCKGIVAGSFDPITNGHVWLIQQACTLLDKLYVVIGVNPSKKYYFSTEVRRQLVEETLAGSLTPEQYGKVEIVYLENDLLINFATQVGVQYIVRGIRDTADFAYESQLRLVNRKINPAIETLFLIPPVELTEVSSSTVKGLVGFNGWETVVAQYVSPVVMRAFGAKTLGDTSQPVPNSVKAWQLYSTQDGAEAAAQALTEALTDWLDWGTQSIAGGLDTMLVAQTVRDNMYEVMTAYEALGARDTEPECVLVEAIATAFRLGAGQLSR